MPSKARKRRGAMSGSKNDHGSTTESVKPNGRDRQAIEGGSAASIDKVRDILFGGQMREVERRFAKLEERLLKETTDLKAHLKSRLDALESFTKKESESLIDQIKTEHEARTDAVGALHKALAPFRRYRINMTKIESRPSKRKAWEYFFFVDCDGHQTDRRVAKAIEQLTQHCSYVKVLGSYPNAE